MADEQAIREIRNAPLDESTVHPDPMRQFRIWYADALRSGVFQPDAMHLATRDFMGAPTGRTVLYKDPERFGLSPDLFLFFTNGQSPKAAHIEAFLQVALTFYWPELQRQIRVQGAARKAPSEVSDRYFETRADASKLGAWASNQSEVIPSRSVLEDRALKYTQQFRGAPIPRPPHWGGFLVTPHEVEFWKHRDDRLHDRIRYQLQDDNSWRIQRLSP